MRTDSAEKDVSRTRRALTFAATGGIAGGGAILGLGLLYGLEPIQELVLVVCAHTVFWSITGAVIGAYTSKRRKMIGEGHARISPRRLSSTIGSFLYRLVVGFLVANIASGVIFVGFVIVTFGVFEKGKDDAFFLAGLSALVGGGVASIVGAFLGAFLGVKKRRKLGGGIFASSGWGSALGIVIGVIHGGACGLVSFGGQDADPFILTLSGILGSYGGILAAILATLLVRKIEPENRSNLPVVSFADHDMTLDKGFVQK